MSPFARNLLSHTSTILIPLLIHQYLALELPVDPGRPSCRTCFASSSFSPTESSRGSLNQRQICEFSSPAAGGFRRFRTLWPSSSFPDPSISFTVSYSHSRTSPPTLSTSIVFCRLWPLLTVAGARRGHHFGGPALQAPPPSRSPRRGAPPTPSSPSRLAPKPPGPCPTKPQPWRLRF
jgi:hypothetical protein